MSSYIFETVEFDNRYPASAFVTSIRNSSFHWHYEYEVIVVLRGSIEVNISTEKYRLTEKDIILVNSKQFHEIKATEEDNICIVFQFHPSLVKSISDDPGNYRFCLNSVSDEIPIKKEYLHFVKLMCRIIRYSYQEDAAAYHRIRAVIFEFVADLFEYVEYDISMRNEAAADEDAAVLRRIIDYIQQHLAEKEVLKSLCKEIGMSERTVHRFMKEHLGLSAKEMLDELRMDKAKAMLKYSSDSMGVIASTCGFGAENTYFRIFKQHTGMTPKEYRLKGKKTRENAELRGYLNVERYDAKQAVTKILEE